MSAQTRRTHVVSAEQRLAVADLSSVCGTLIRDGKRSPEMVRVLLRALQLFKEHKLAGALAQKISSPEAMDREEIEQIYSLRFCDTSLAPLVQKYLRERGCLYVGEVVGLVWDPRPSTEKHRQEVEALFLEFGISLELASSWMQWKPPYATDPLVRASWDKPVGKVLKLKDTDGHFRYLHGLHKRGVHYAGQMFRTHGSQDCRVQKKRHRVFRNDSGLHGGMIVSGWTPPSGQCPEWISVQMHWNSQDGQSPRHYSQWKAEVYE